ncbi:hypothetical protein RJ53_00260 [Methanocalculus chunghsingensis]|uniref:Uncharacterized protein n=1 Tax=Methanocalculus chunghsingensis TaxID=156457 RepID=A0A8J8B5W2_9EURY|nr:hypothetical protein [Methanocalculus chunghsingensis]MBR1368007.1 hypothetical protein [Methanocalculus chunghsingensis]
MHERIGSSLFFECKWPELSTRDARSVIAALREKAEYVQWRDGDRKERYALVARKIDGKEQLRDEGYHVIDLEEITLLSEKFLADKGN